MPGPAAEPVGNGRLRVAMVTNIPAPYRLPVYDRLAAEPDLDFSVLYCSAREPDREWTLGEGRARHVYLKEHYARWNGRFIHFNPDVWDALARLRPEVLITTGFNPTHLIAYLYARRHHVAHVAMTDGTFTSELELSFVHRWLRRRVYRHSAAFLSASTGGDDLYRAYGVEEGRLFRSPLCVDNARFQEGDSARKSVDLLFCGRFVAVKNPLFALGVARDAARVLGRRVSIAFVGGGPLEADLRAAALAAAQDVDARFPGFAQQGDLPGHYRNARVFLFPTSWDPWGVVANEACAAGLPVLVSPFAGSANELIRDGENGYVLPLDSQAWSQATARLLADPDLQARLGQRGQEMVRRYTFDRAAEGIAAAIRHTQAKEQPSGMSVQRRRRVLVTQRRMTHYRVPLFEQLKTRLAERDIDLFVVYGDTPAREKARRDEGFLPWGIRVPAQYALYEHLCWQDFRRAALGADLLVVTQENKLLLNHLLVVGPRRFRLAFWGHGRNFQASRYQRFSEILKGRLLPYVDWWFAYTDASKSVVLDRGFPANRITVLNNATDTRTLRADLAAADAVQADAFRAALKIPPGTLGLFLGSFTPEKKLELLMGAAPLLRKAVTDFQLVLVGDGPERAMVESAANEHDWIHWVGPRVGREKALLLSAARVLLNPGMVGLSVVESFAAGVPIVTTRQAIHSPEIAYVQPERNGLITAPDVRAFAEGAIRVMREPCLHEQLRAGCAVAAGEYTLENMVTHFADGIEACLRAGRHSAALARALPPRKSPAL
jgi:glycosyltransferase involved in cell wall biosynthesis